jgi:hypothetical protein
LNIIVIPAAEPPRGNGESILRRRGFPNRYRWPKPGSPRRTVDAIAARGDGQGV